MRFIISLGLKILAGLVILGGLFQAYVALKEIIMHHMPQEIKKKTLFILLWFLVAGICFYGANSPSLASLFPKSSPAAISTPTVASSSPTQSATSSPTATVVTLNPIPSTTSNLSPASQPTATTPPSSQLSYQENFEQNNSSWNNGGYTVEDANSIVCMDIEINTPCSGIVHYTPTSANYKMDLTVRFTQTSYIGTGNVLCLEERTNTAFPQGVKIGILADGYIYNGCLDMSDQNYIGTFHLNVLKEFDVSLVLKGADLSILVSQQGNNFSFDLPTLVDTDPGNISIIAYYPVVVSNIAIYTN